MSPALWCLRQDGPVRACRSTRVALCPAIPKPPKCCRGCRTHPTVADLLATGGTLEACARLLRDDCKADIRGITVLIELETLGGAKRVDDFGHLHSVLKF